MIMGIVRKCSFYRKILDRECSLIDKFLQVKAFAVFGLKRWVPRWGKVHIFKATTGGKGGGG